MAMCPLVFGQGSTLLRCLRPGQAGPACPNEIFNDKDDLKHQSSREGTNIEYFLVAAGQSHLYLINECHLLLNGLKTYGSYSTTPNYS
ncbi:hypothetical protein VPH35_060374 [Triticum aestivum]